MSKAPATSAVARPDGETPIRRQYQRLKAEHPGCVLLFQLGDFFECFEEDARTLSRVCAVTLTSREFGKGDRVALAGVPVTRLEHYLARLLEAGLHVAVAEQVSQPGAGLVDRAITRVVTPGTLAEPGLLREKENNYLAAVCRGRSGLGLAFVDVSTGEFAATQFDGDDAEVRLRAEIERIDPAEVLIQEGHAPLIPAGSHVTVCQPWRFDEEGSRERLCAQLGVLSLEGFGCAGLPLAVGSAGAIVSYLEEHNRRLLPTIGALRTYSTAVGMPLDHATRRTLELLRNARSGRVQGSLLEVLDRTRTPMGGRLLRRWLSQPLLDPAAIAERLDAVERLFEDDASRVEVTRVLSHIGDVERVLGRVAQGVASPRELRDLAESLRAVADLRWCAPSDQSAATGSDADRIDPCAEVVDLVTAGVAPPYSGRTVRPGYAPDLDALIARNALARRTIAQLEQVERERTGIKSLKVGFNKVFGYYLEITRPNLALVPACYQRKQTLVGAERFITAELKESEAEILHAEERIQDLEREVYQDVLRRVAGFGARLRATAHAVACLDVFAALANLARERGYCRPIVDDGTEIHIIAGRHPVVEARLERGAFIENDCRLGGPQQQIMLLTGPNMAGKSTYLRQVALIALMAQLGSFVPARSARIGLVDRIFTRVGAQDDIAAGASTFMVEMMEAANILRNATARSLVVLDEIGRGTSTFDGLSIARALVEEIHQHVGARTLFATHFHELAVMANELPGLQVFNVSVAEEDGEVVFLRRVLPGAADRSYGIQVARLAGLPSTVTVRAEEILRDLEAGRGRDAPAKSADHFLPPYQMQLDGFDLPPARAAGLLAELLALDVSTMTPLEALNQLSEVQRRAGRL